MSAAAAESVIDRENYSQLSIVLICAAAMTIASVDRVNISVAALAMQRYFDWSDSVKGVVLASFFVGYVLTQIVGGWLAHRYGGERVLVGALILWSLFAAMTPAAGHLGLSLLIVTRVALGACEGPANPAAYHVLGRWIPAPNLPTALASYGSAGFLGCIIAMLVTGPLVVTFGWESPFYVSGGVGLVFVACTYPAFRNLMLRRRAEASSTPGRSKLVTPIIPWRRLLSLREFWALVTTFFCTAWVYYVLMLWMPSYFERAHGLTISQSGLLSLAPWVIMLVVMNITGLVAALLVRRGFGETTVRKLLTAGGLLGTGGALLFVPHAATAIVAALLLSAALGFLAITYAGLAPNVFDLAPRYGHVLFSILNTFGALPGIVGVSLTGWLVQVTHSFNAALISAALLAMFGAIVFLRFGSARPLVD